MGFFMSTLYLPVFHELNITSTYEVRKFAFDELLNIFPLILCTQTVFGGTFRSSSTYVRCSDVYYHECRLDSFIAMHACMRCTHLI